MAAGLGVGAGDLIRVRVRDLGRRFGTDSTVGGIQGEMKGVGVGQYMVVSVSSFDTPALFFSFFVS